MENIKIKGTKKRKKRKKGNRTLQFIFLLLLLSLIFFYKIPFNYDEILYSDHSDLIGQYSYWKYFIKSSFEQYKEIPLWNPYSFSGQPFLGNLHYQVFYPPFTLFLLINPDLLFGYMFIFHCFLAGTFMFFLLREFKLNNFSSFIGAITYMISFRFIMHVYSGHLSILPTVVCLPLAFFFTEKAIKNKRIYWASLSGLTLGIQFLGAHTQYFFYTCFFISCYIIFSSLTRLKIKKIILLLLTTFIITTLIASIQLIPSYEFSRYSTRSSGLDTESSIKFSLPPYEIISFIIPKFFGDPRNNTYFGRWNITETAAYIGVLPFIFALVTIFIINRKNHYQYKDYRIYKYFFTFSTIFSLLFAFGKYTPLFWFFYKFIPGFNFFRGPSKMLFFYVFFMIILASIGFDWFLKHRNSNQIKRIKKVLATILIISLLCITVSFILRDRIINLGEELVSNLYLNNPQSNRIVGENLDFFISKVPQIYYHILVQLILFTILLILSFLVFYNALKNKKIFFLLILFVILFDLTLFSATFIQTKPIIDVFKSNGHLNTIKIDMVDNGQIFRILDLSGLLPQHITIRHNIQKTLGYDPMILNDYYNYIHELGNGPNRNLEVININKVSNHTMLNWLNVKYIIDKDSKLVMNKGYLPRAFFSEDGSKAEIEFYSPNKIIVNTSGRIGELILCENYFPGWKAYINNESEKNNKINVYKVNRIFRAVNVNKPTNKVIFVYDPLSYKIGKILSLIGIIIVLFIFFLDRKKIKEANSNEIKKKNQEK